MPALTNAKPHDPTYEPTRPQKSAELMMEGYLSRLQDQTTSVAAILEAVDILLEDDRRRNATVALVSIALAKIKQIDLALDCTVWPKVAAL